MSPANNISICLIALCSACSSGSEDTEPDASLAQIDAADTSALPYAREVVSFTPGPGAGFGQERLPDVVTGPPAGKGTAQASTDVLSLGVGGEIVLGFGDLSIVDEAGPDFVVFENPFWIGNDPMNPFAELGEVSVSSDGVTWHTFTCDLKGNGSGLWPGCAGFSPTLEYDAFSLLPIDLGQSGGDGFDLADLGLSEVRFVRIVDLASSGDMPSAGFDLDAVGLIHWSQSQ